MGRSRRASPETGGLITALRPPAPPVPSSRSGFTLPTRTRGPRALPLPPMGAIPSSCHCGPGCGTATMGLVAHGRVWVMLGQSPHGPWEALRDHWGQCGWGWRRVARGQEVSWRPAQGRVPGWGSPPVPPALRLCSPRDAAPEVAGKVAQGGHGHLFAQPNPLPECSFSKVPEPERDGCKKGSGRLARLPSGSLCRQPPRPGPHATTAHPLCTTPQTPPLSPDTKFAWGKKNNTTPKCILLPREAGTGSELLANRREVWSMARGTAREPGAPTPSSCCRTTGAFCYTQV